MNYVKSFHLWLTYVVLCKTQGKKLLKAWKKGQYKCYQIYYSFNINIRFILIICGYKLFTFYAIKDITFYNLHIMWKVGIVHWWSQNILLWCLCQGMKQFRTLYFVLTVCNAQKANGATIFQRNKPINLPANFFCYRRLCHYDCNPY